MIDKLQRNLWLNSGKLDAEKAYWIRKLEGDFRFGRFPTMRTYAASRIFERKSINAKVPDEISTRLEQISRGSEYAKFTVLLAGVKHLLSVYADIADIAVGMPVFNSKNQQAARLNVFVPLRTEVDHGLSFKDLLAAVKQTITEASANSNFPIEELGKLKGLPCDENGFPLAHTTVVYDSVHDWSYMAGVPYDVLFRFRREEDNSLLLTLDFNGDLYEQETMDRMIGHLYSLYRQALEQPSAPMDRLSFIPDEELALLTANAARTQTDHSHRLPKADQGEAEFHPLMQEFTEQSVRRWVMETELSTQMCWELKEHLIQGQYTLPGTAYLEIAAYGARAFFQQDQIQLEDVEFHVPLMMTENGRKRLRTVLEKEGGRLLFRAESANYPIDGDKEWTVHATCSISILVMDRPGATDVSSLREQCSIRSVVIEPGSKNPNTEGFGPRWQGIESYRYGESQALVQVKLADSYSLDLPRYCLHPALLDLCTASYVEDDRIYLPVYYKRVQVYASLTGKMFSHLMRKKNDSDQAETVTYDIRIMDESGKLLVFIEDFTLYAIRDMSVALKSLTGKPGLFHRVTWIPAVSADRTENMGSGTVLLLREETPLGRQLSSLYEERGWTVIDVLPGERFDKHGERRYSIGGDAGDYTQLFTALQGYRFSHIVHMFYESEDQDISSLEALEQLQSKGVWSLYHLIIALDPSKLADSADLFLVTREAFEVTSLEKTLRPAYAPLLGLGKVVDVEFPFLRCRGFDIDASISAERLYTDFRGSAQPQLTAYRNGTDYVEMLDKVGDDEENTTAGSINVTGDGVYLITGGTGGLGLEAAKLLHSQGPVRLALLSRTKFPDKSLWNSLADGTDRKLAAKIESIRQMEQNGSVVSLYDADTADQVRMAEVISELKARFGPIRGVIHAAGVAGDSMLNRRSPEAFRQVLRPKIEGTFVLDRLTEEEPLEFFVLFSSIATLGGASGQGDYTAANCFLDAYASFRSRQGKRTLAINWAGWKETGMAADYGTEETYFKSLSTETACRSMIQALNRGESRLVIGELNTGHPVFDDLSRMPIQFSPAIMQLLRMSKPFKKPQREPGMQSDRGASEDAATELEEQIAGIICELLGLERISVEDDFFDIGGHSILAIKLLVELEKNGLPADGLDVNEANTAKAMAAFLQRKEGAAS